MTEASASNRGAPGITAATSARAAKTKQTASRPTRQTGEPMTEPNPQVCLWWDWKQPSGKVERIRYMPGWKLEYPWHSIERAYSQRAIDVIGGEFVPAPLAFS